MFKMTKIWMGVLVLLLLSSTVAGRPTKASQNKPPRKKTNLTYADRQAWRKILKWPQDCDDAFRNQGEDYAGVNFYRLAARKYLVEVECEVAAYQSVRLYLLYDESTSPARSKPLTFKSYSGETEDSLKETQQESLLGESTFDNRRKTLTVLYKLSRLGDCGSLATYSFRSGTPVLIDYREKFTCDNEDTGDHSHWRRIMPPRHKPQRRWGR